jgi:cytochrome c-type biogenesis protein CcmE
MEREVEVPAPRDRSRLLKVLITLSVLVVGGGILIYSSLGHAEYYKMVDELMVEPDKWVGKDLRVHGWVKAGSIDEDIVDQKTVREFYLEHKGQMLLVKNSGPKPDTFRDLSEVVAEGRLIEHNGTYVLEADKLMAKCPSKYEGAVGNQDFEHKPVFGEN